MSPPPRSSSLSAVPSAASVLAVRRRERHRRDEDVEGEEEDAPHHEDAAPADRAEAAREDVGLAALVGEDLAWAARQDVLSGGTRTLADEVPSRVRGVAAYARASDD